MMRVLVGLFFLAVAFAVLLWAVWARVVGHGRHRRPAGATHDETTSHGDESGGDMDTLTMLLAADRVDYDHCPAEGRRTPHYFHADGARTCCSCETTTAGDS